MKNYIKEFKQTGECPIYLDAVVSQWNNRCSIIQWHNEFSLSEDNWRAGKRLGRSKISISSGDAFTLIAALNLRNEQSAFKSGSVWRTSESERDYVSSEVAAYFQMNPGKKPSKFVQNVINTLEITI